MPRYVSQYQDTRILSCSQRIKSSMHTQAKDTWSVDITKGQVNDVPASLLAERLIFEKEESKRMNYVPPVRVYFVISLISHVDKHNIA